MSSRRVRDSGGGLFRGLRGGLSQGRRLGGSFICRCPKCGHSQPHDRGVPCTSVSCPKCGTRMRGEHCQ